MDLFTPTWWHAAGRRAAYTALAALLPLAALLFTGDVTPLYTLSVVALAALASLVTSLAGLPEVTDKVVPWWQAVVVRVLKTAGQVAAPVLGSVLLFEDVGWYELGVTVAGAAFTTLLRALMAYLPEDADEVTLTRQTAAPVGGDVTARELVVHDPEGAVIARIGRDGIVTGNLPGDGPQHRAGD